jgi:hypothetical protein
LVFTKEDSSFCEQKEAKKLFIHWSVRGFPASAFGGRRKGSFLQKKTLF